MDRGDTLLTFSSTEAAFRIERNTMQTVAAPKKLPIYRSIQGQLIISFLILGILPLLIIGGVAFSNANTSLRDSIGNTLDGVATAKAVRLAAWMQDTARAAIALSKTAGLRGSAELDNFGVQVISQTRQNSEQAEAYRQAYSAALAAMSAFKETYVRIDEIFLFDRNGLLVVSTNNNFIKEGTLAKDIPTIDFNAGLKETTISDITTSIDGVTRIFSVLTPVTAPDGSIIGVVGTRNNLDTINSIMTDYTGLGETGETYLADSVSHVVRTALRHEGTDLLDKPIETYPLQMVDQGVVDGIAEYTNYLGLTVLGSWAPVENTRWMLLAEIDTNEAFAPINALMNATLILIVVAVIVILAASTWIARSFSRPITRITDAAVQVADGALEAQADVKSSNELGILASAFNRMTANLRRMVESERDSKQYLESTLSRYAAFIESVAHGNLKDRLHMNGSSSETDDLIRLGHNLNTMVENLNQMTSQIQETVAVLSSTVMEIQASTTQQTAAATEQDAAVTQTVATVEEVRVTVQQTSERAKSVAQASQQSVSVSRSGQDTVTDTVRRMDTLRKQVDNIAENILMLSERTQQIGEIIDTVNGLAEQSKLLALNASIEAARAGEEGKGFAVVAMEVRQLAEQSREATSRVRQILSEIQQATNSAVMVTEEGSKEAESGMKMAENAGQVIRNLAGTIEETAQAASQIAASTNQQSVGMNQLVTAMSQIKQAATQTAASTRQTEVSIRELNEMAKRLEHAVKGYTI